MGVIWPSQKEVPEANGEKKKRKNREPSLLSRIRVRFLVANRCMRLNFSESSGVGFSGKTKMLSAFEISFHSKTLAPADLTF
jgi:hypothetical protein